MDDPSKRVDKPWPGCWKTSFPTTCSQLTHTSPTPVYAILQQIWLIFFKKWVILIMSQRWDQPPFSPVRFYYESTRILIKKRAGLFGYAFQDSTLNLSVFFIGFAISPSLRSVNRSNPVLMLDCCILLRRSRPSQSSWRQAIVISRGHLTAGSSDASVNPQLSMTFSLFG